MSLPQTKGWAGMASLNSVHNMHYMYTVLNEGSQKYCRITLK